MTEKPNLESDLIKSDEIVRKVKNDDYAVALYGALCNNQFFKMDIDDNECLNTDNAWICSWRYSGGIIAKLRDEGETYLDFYCSGNEGEVTDEIKQDLRNLGWIHKGYE